MRGGKNQAIFFGIILLIVSLVFFGIHPNQFTVDANQKTIQEKTKQSPRTYVFGVSTETYLEVVESCCMKDHRDDKKLNDVINITVQKYFQEQNQVALLRINTHACSAQRGKQIIQCVVKYRVNEQHPALIAVGNVVQGVGTGVKWMKEGYFWAEIIKRTSHMTRKLPLIGWVLQSTSQGLVFVDNQIAHVPIIRSMTQKKMNIQSQVVQYMFSIPLIAHVVGGLQSFVQKRVPDFLKNITKRVGSLALFITLFSVIDAFAEKISQELQKSGKQLKEKSSKQEYQMQLIIQIKQ